MPLEQEEKRFKEILEAMRRHQEISKYRNVEWNPPGEPIPCRIAVSGRPGSGTTTLCKWLSELCGFRYYYAGEVMRGIAASRNQPIEDFYEELAQDPELEKRVDKEQAALMRQENYIIAEGRMAPFLAPDIKKIKLLLTVDLFTGTARQMQRPENQKLTFFQVFVRSWERTKTERERYLKLYGIANHFDPSCFDIAIDTTLLTVEEVRSEALRRISDHIKRHIFDF